MGRSARGGTLVSNSAASASHRFRADAGSVAAASSAADAGGSFCNSEGGAAVLGPRSAATLCVSYTAPRGSAGALATGGAPPAKSERRTGFRIIFFFRQVRFRRPRGRGRNLLYQVHRNSKSSTALLAFCLVVLAPFSCCLGVRGFLLRWSSALWRRRIVSTVGADIRYPHLEHAISARRYAPVLHNLYDRPPWRYAVGLRAQFTLSSIAY